jgi:hypothetical protein
MSSIVAARPSVTVGFFPRERFSIAPRTLKRLLEATGVEFQLLIVDCRMPARYRKRIEALVQGRPGVEFIHSDRYLMPNESRELIAGASRSDYTCMLENDALVSDGWLSQLIAACEQTGAGAAAPLVLEGRNGRHHDDDHTGRFVFSHEDGRKRLDFEPLGSGPDDTPQAIEVSECHCLLFRTEVLRDAAIFDGTLTSRDFIDISLALRHAGVSFVFEPRAQVRFLPPPPVRPDDRAFFTMRWDRQRALASHARIRDKWGIDELQSAMDFVAERPHRLSYQRFYQHAIASRLRRLVKHA